VVIHGPDADIGPLGDVLHRGGGDPPIAVQRHRGLHDALMGLRCALGSLIW